MESIAPKRGSLVQAGLKVHYREGEALLRLASLTIASQTCCAHRWHPSARRQQERFVSRRGGLADETRRSWAQVVLNGYSDKHLTLLADETKLSDHLGVMMISLLVDGGSIPLVWRSYLPHHYPAEGQVELIVGLLSLICAVRRPGQRLLMLVDQGLGTSPALIRQLARLDVDYLFRVQETTRLKTQSGHSQPLRRLAQPGRSLRCGGFLFKKAGWLPGYAYLHWKAGYQQPWCLLSNRHDLHPALYASRFQQEVSFRDLKSDGFGWDKSRVWTPAHCDRLLLILALAYALLMHAAPALAASLRPALRRKFSLFRIALDCLATLLYPSFAPWLCPFAIPPPQSCLHPFMRIVGV